MKDPAPDRGPRPTADPDRLGDCHASAGFFERRQEAELARLVTRPDLPRTFERWQLELAPGAERRTAAAEWAGALVLLAAGRLEVDCRVGGRHTIEAGDLLVLGWLPLRVLRNPGRVPVRLVAVRRRGDRPTAGLLRVIRHSGP
jgi:hypothetical protein